MEHRHRDEADVVWPEREHLGQYGIPMKAMRPWEHLTAFGAPEVPDVKMRYPSVEGVTVGRPASRVGAPACPQTAARSSA